MSMSKLSVDKFDYKVINLRPCDSATPIKRNHKCESLLLHSIHAQKIYFLIRQGTLIGDVVVGTILC